jgi:hypothetical protein
MTNWIFQGNRTREDLESALATSPVRSWRTLRYRDRAAAGDRAPAAAARRRPPAT